jgi:hypothetical protein
MAHQIDEIQQYGQMPIFYFEGHSGKLAAGLIPPDPGEGYSWFCFEEEFAAGCVELMKLGFTAQQIEEAIHG